MSPRLFNPVLARVAAQLSQLYEREALKERDGKQAAYLLKLSDRARARALRAGWKSGDDPWKEPRDPDAIYMAPYPYPPTVLVAMSKYGLTDSIAIVWQRGEDYLVDCPSRELVVRVRADGETDSCEVRDLDDALVVFAIRDREEKEVA